MADDKKVIRLVVKVPSKDTRPFKARGADIRRNRVKEDIGRGIPNVTQKYGITPTMKSNGNDTIHVDFPAPSKDISFEDVQRVLLANCHDGLVYETSLTFVGVGKDEKKSERGNGSRFDSSEVVNILSKYQAIRKTPEELKRDMAEMEGDLAKKLEAIDQLENEGIELLDKISQLENVPSLDNTDLGNWLVGYVRRLPSSENYAESARLYDGKFPKGLDDGELRSALEGDELSFVVTDQLRALCVGEKAAIDLSPGRELEQIVGDIEERCLPFKESAYFTEPDEFLRQLAAQSLTEKVEKMSDEEIEEGLPERIQELIPYAKEVAGEEANWESARKNAIGVNKYVTERKELYAIARSIASDNPLSMQIPMAAFYTADEKGTRVYLSIPGARTEDKNYFTAALWWDVFHSANDAIGSKVIEDIGDESRMDTYVSTFVIPKSGEEDQRSEKERFTEFIGGFSEAFKTHSLYKLGTRLEINVPVEIVQ